MKLLDRGGNLNLKTASLAIDTSQPHYSLAFTVNEQEALIDSNQDWRHAEDILTTIIEITKKHNIRPKDIDKLLINVGPGSFTGLRIGIAIAKGFSIASPSTIITPISTYEIIRKKAKILGKNTYSQNIVISAGRGEFSIAEFDNNDRITKTELMQEEEFLAYSNSHSLTILSDKLASTSNMLVTDKICAKDLALCLDKDFYPNYSQLIPIYFRPPDAKISRICDSSQI